MNDEFSNSDPQGGAATTSRIVVDVLSDVISVRDIIGSSFKNALDADPSTVESSIDEAMELVGMSWPPPPGFPPPTPPPFSPQDLGKPMLDLSGYVNGSTLPSREDNPEPSRDDTPLAGARYLKAFLKRVEPVSGREPFDWDPTEAALGRALPREFTRFLDIFGDFIFGSVFRPYHPSIFPYVDLITRTAEFHETLTRYPAGEWPADTIMAHMDLTRENTIVWGGADNGDYHLWHLSSENPDEWTILLIGAHFHDWYSFTGSVPELMYRWMFDDLPDLPEYWSKESRLHGQSLSCEFGPYHPDGSPMATYDLTRKEWSRPEGYFAPITLGPNRQISHISGDNPYERGQLTGSLLGGPGDVPENTCPMRQYVKQTIMAQWEQRVVDVIQNGIPEEGVPQQNVYVMTRPIYRGKEMTPEKLLLLAHGDKGFSMPATYILNT